jgi:hypothetical protein
MEERTCFNCIKFDLCHIRNQVSEAIKVNMNIDGDDAPGTTMDIHKAVANACLSYESHTMQAARVSNQSVKVLREALTHFRDWFLFSDPKKREKPPIDEVQNALNATGE